MSARRAGRIRRTIVSTAAGATLAVGSIFLAAPPAAAATTATFSPSTGTMTVFGDSQGNVITISRNVGGAILVNGGAIPVLGGSPSVANTALIQVFGQGGADTISLSEVSGALPRAFLFGGADNDVMTGGSGADQIFGQSGNDTLTGRGSSDLLFGGTENDVLTGGDADDQVFGEAGDDRMIWNSGDDTDLDEGGAGTDRVEINGGTMAEEFRATANGTRVRFDRLDPAPFAVDIGTSERLAVNAGAGNDRFDTVGSLAALIQIEVRGGAGDDVLVGSNGNDFFVGEDGDDVVRGGDGDDVALLGAGADTFQWNPGDDDDIIEGQTGVDKMIFTGSSVSEQIDVSANGGRVRFFRNVANVTMDLNDLERIEFAAGGGADRVDVRDLSGTDVTDVDVDLAQFGSATADGSPDIVSVDGTNGADVIQLAGSTAAQQVLGLASRVTVRNSDPAPVDRVTIAAGRGDDVVIATSLTSPAGMAADGGDGSDVLVGSDGDDLLSGSDGDDVLVGGLGTDVLNGGAGDDVLLGGEVVTDGQVVTKAWLAQHARAVRGGTVLDLGGRPVQLPGVSVTRLG